MQSELLEQARHIVASVPCITIATLSADGQPWSTPLTAASDENFNFYWTSYLKTKHSLNIEHNSHISISIFDSTDKANTLGAVHIDATCEVLPDGNELQNAVEWLYKHKGKEAPDINTFVGDTERCMYKAKPKRLWINRGPRAEDPHHPRIELFI